MSARRLALLLAAFAVALIAGACDDVPFASVELLLRQPEGIGDRTRDPSCTGREDACLQLSRSLDDAASEGVSLANDFRGPTGALPLGREQHVLALEAYVGDPANPTLLGRADPVTLPIIDATASEVTFVRPAVLAALDDVEPLFESVPPAVATGAACADAAGNAWLFGATSWAFPTRSLRPERVSPFVVPAGASVACAAQLEPSDSGADLSEERAPVIGRFYTFVGNCGSGGGALRAGVTSVDLSADVGVGNGCDALVAVRDDALWVVQGDVVTLHERATFDVTNTSAAFTPSATPRTSAIVLADGTLLVAEPGGGTTHYSPSGEDSVRSEAGRDLEVARFITFDGVAWALTTAELLVNLDSASAPGRELALPNVTGIVSAGIMRDGTVVALGTEGVAVEGAAATVPAIAGRGRFALTITVGSAVLLWGGAGGVDVLVPSRPELLSAR